MHRCYVRKECTLLALPYPALPPRSQVSVLPGLCRLGEAMKGGVPAAHSKPAALEVRL